MFKTLVEQRKRLAVFTAVSLVLQTIWLGTMSTPSPALASQNQIWDFNTTGDYTTDTNLSIFEHTTGNSSLHFKTTWSSASFGDGLAGVSGARNMTTAASGTIWIVDSVGAVYKSTDGGANWNAAVIATITIVYDLIELTAGNLVAVGDNGANSPIVAYSSDDGANWSTGALVAGTAEAMVAVTYDSSNAIVYGIAGNALVFSSSDNGQTWAQTAGDASTQLSTANDITWTSGSTLVAVGSAQGTVAGSVLSFSADGGTNWNGGVFTGSGSATASLSRVYYNSDGWLYIAGYESGSASVILKNINLLGGGQMDNSGDWNNRTVGWLNTTILSLDLIDLNGVLFFLGYDTSTYVLKSTLDQGAHWLDHTTDNLGKGLYASMSFTSSNQLLIGGQETGTNVLDVFGGTFAETTSSAVGLVATSNVGTITAVTADYHALNTDVLRVAFGETSGDGDSFYYYDTVGNAWTADTLDISTSANTVAELTAERLATMPLSINGGGDGGFYVKFYGSGSLGKMLIADSFTLTYDEEATGGGGNNNDVTPPDSQVTALNEYSPVGNPCGPTLLVSATAQDTGGAQVAEVVLFISQNGVNFTKWDTPDVQRPYEWEIPVDHNQKYYFYTIATDTAGNVEPAPENPAWDTFTTVDAVRPVLTHSWPYDGADNIPTNEPIVLNFSEPIVPESFNFELYQGIPYRKGSSFNGNKDVAWSNNNQTATITHDAFGYFAYITVEILGAQDRAQNSLTDSLSWCERLLLDMPPMEQPLEFSFTTITRQDPDLRESTLTVADGPNQNGSYNPGDEVVYTLYLENTSTMNADNTTVTIMFPKGISFADTDDTRFRVLMENGIAVGLEWTGSVPGYIPGWDPRGPDANKVTTTYTMRVNSPATERMISQTAIISDGINPSFETLPPAIIMVADNPDYAGSQKTVDKTEARPGDVLTYTIAVKNTGTTAAVTAINDFIPQIDGGGELFFKDGSITYDQQDERWQFVPEYKPEISTLDAAAILQPDGVPITFSFQAVLRGDLPEMDVVNTAYIWDPTIFPEQQLELTASTHVPGGDDPMLRVAYTVPEADSDNNGFKQNIEIGFNSPVDLERVFDYVVTEAGSEIDLEAWNPTWSDFNGMSNAKLTLTPPDDFNHQGELGVGAEYEVIIYEAYNIYGKGLEKTPEMWHFTTADPIVEITYPTVSLYPWLVDTLSEPFAVKLKDSLSGKDYKAEENIQIGLKAYAEGTKVPRETVSFWSAPNKQLPKVNPRITIAKGTSTGTFYYKDSAVSSPDYFVIETAEYHDPYLGWPDDVQYVETISDALPKNAIKMELSNTRVRVGQYSAPINITAKTPQGRNLTLPEKLYFYSNTTTGAFYDVHMNKLPYLVVAQNDENGMPQYLNVGAGQTGVTVYFKDLSTGLNHIVIGDNFPQWPEVGLADASAIMNIYQALDEDELLEELEELEDDSGRMIDNIVIKPSDTTLLPNGKQVFKATAYDTEGKVIEGLKFKWHVLVEGSGTIDLDGNEKDSATSTFIAEEGLGVFYDNVLVATIYNDKIGYAVASVTIADVVDKGGPKKLPVTGMNGLQLVLLGLTLAAAVALAWVEHYDKTHFKNDNLSH